MKVKLPKSCTRILAEKIKASTGEGLVKINRQAMELVETGLVPSRKAALEHILNLVMT